MKGYFQYYETFEKIVQKFKTEEARNVFRAKIVSYGLFGIEPELNELEDMVWDIIKEMIDDQIHKRQVNSENRKKTSTPAPAENVEDVVTVEQVLNEEVSTENEIKGTETNQNENLEQEIPSAELNRNEMNGIEKKRNEVNEKHSHFQKPTVAEIESYCQERKNGINAQRFFDYYESKGWVVGKSPMKDWKASVRTWEQKADSPTPANVFQRQQGTMLPADRLIL